MIPKLVEKWFQTVAENEQEKKRWSRDSFPWLQSKHSGSTCNPQVINRSLVGLRFSSINQARVWCFGIPLLIQMRGRHRTVGVVGRRKLYTLEDENDLMFLPLLIQNGELDASMRVMVVR